MTEALTSRLNISPESLEKLLPYLEKGWEAVEDKMQIGIPEVTSFLDEVPVQEKGELRSEDPKQLEDVTSMIENAVGDCLGLCKNANDNPFKLNAIGTTRPMDKIKNIFREKFGSRKAIAATLLGFIPGYSIAKTIDEFVTSIFLGLQDKHEFSVDKIKFLKNLEEQVLMYDMTCVAIVNMPSVASEVTVTIAGKRLGFVRKQKRTLGEICKRWKTKTQTLRNKIQEFRLKHMNAVLLQAWRERQMLLNGKDPLQGLPKQSVVEDTPKNPVPRVVKKN